MRKAEMREISVAVKRRTRENFHNQNIRMYEWNAFIIALLND